MTGTDDSRGTVTIGQFVALLLRRWPVVLAGLLIGVAAAAAGAALVPPSFTSRAVVTVTAVDLDPLRGDSSSDVSTVTEANVVQSTSVAERAAALIGSDAPASELLEQVDVSSPLGSSVLEIEFTAASPQAAAAGANAFAEAYLTYRADTARAAIDQSNDRLEEQVGVLDREIVSLDTLIADEDTTDAQRDRLESSRNQLAGQADQLRAQQVQLRTVQVVPGQQVDRGLAPTGSGAPPLLVFLVGGAVLGLVLGVVAAVWRDRRDDLVSGPSSLRAAASVPVLVQLPRSPGSDRGSDGLPPPMSVDPLNRLATKLLAAAQSTGGQSFLLAGPAVPTHHENLPQQLAVTLASQRLRVVLVGCAPAVDAAASSLGAAPPPPPRDGVPVTDATLRTVTTDGVELYLLQLGPESRVEGELFRRRDEYRHVLRAADIVIIDGLNVQASGTTLSLAQIATGSLVVAEHWRSRGAAVRKSCEELSEVGTPTSGAVLLTRSRPGRVARRRPVSASRPEHRSAQGRPASTPHDPAGSSEDPDDHGPDDLVRAGSSQG